MEEKFVWKAEIRFEGTAEMFNQVAETLEKLPVEIEIPEWKFRPPHLAGCMPLPLERLIDKDRLNKLVEGMPVINIKYIKDIYGGMRTPHLHLGDDVVLFDRARFAQYVSEVASSLGAMRAEALEDYVDVMNPVGHLATMRTP
jgi:hypothetical protein